MPVVMSPTRPKLNDLGRRSAAGVQRTGYEGVGRVQQIDSADGLGVVTYLGRSGKFALRKGVVSGGRREQLQSVSGEY